MKQRSITSGTVTTAQCCPCGCAPCDTQCCELECLVRPEFFCGQLLTDEDLTALVKWNRTHYRLGRYQYGWGVACGLELTRDPKNPAGVLLHPGYALDCCGNDIVVCEPSAYSLAKLCPQGKCQDLRSEQKQLLEQIHERANSLLGQVKTALEQDLNEEQRQETTAAAEALQKALESDNYKALIDAIAASEKFGKEYGFDFAEKVKERSSLFDSSLHTAQALDLFLHYDEHGAEPQAALRGGACGPNECHDSRIYEGQRLSWQVVVPQLTAPNPWDDWAKRYTERRSIAQAFFKASKAAADANDMKSLCAELTRWLNDPAHPAGPFCFARDSAQELCATANQVNFTYRYNLAELIFWLIVDDLVGWMECGCPVCNSATGIPLARVWLGGEDTKSCRVLAIDSAPPRRRLLQQDACLPSRPNLVDASKAGMQLGHLLGRRWDAIQSDLRMLGFVDTTVQLLNLSQHGGAIEKILGMSAEMLAPYRDTKISALTIDLGGDWGQRVLAFV